LTAEIARSDSASASAASERVASDCASCFFSCASRACSSRCSAWSRRCCCGVAAVGADLRAGAFFAASAGFFASDERVCA